MADEPQPAEGTDLTPPVADAEARAAEVGDGSKVEESTPVNVATEPGEDMALPAGQRPPTADSVRVEILNLEGQLAANEGGYLAYEGAKKGADGDLVRSQNRPQYEAYERIKARVDHLRSKLGSAG